MPVSEAVALSLGVVENRVESNKAGCFSLYTEKTKLCPLNTGPVFPSFSLFCFLSLFCFYLFFSPSWKFICGNSTGRHQPHAGHSPGIACAVFGKQSCYHLAFVGSWTCVGIEVGLIFGLRCGLGSCLVLALDGGVVLPCALVFGWDRLRLLALQAKAFFPSLGWTVCSQVG